MFDFQCALLMNFRSILYCTSWTCSFI